MSKFFSLTIKDLRRETEDCVSIAFVVPPELQETFRFKHGQYLTLRKEINQEDVRRSYSICSSPLEGELRVAVKKVEGGRFSTFANEQLRPGDTLEAMPPLGHFTNALDPVNRKHYAAFAAGSGITPVMSILKTILATEPQSHFTLFYGNRGFDSIIFREELEALKNRYLGRFSVHHIFSRERMDISLFYGRLDAEKCPQILKKLITVETVAEWFLCGPESMISATKESLLHAGVSEKQIHFELFTSPAGALGQKTHVTAKAFDPTRESKVTIRLDGTSFDFVLPYGGKNILDASLQQGADLPYSCKGGVCCTCRAKLVEGEVDMDVNYALEPEEVDAGFILTCQSHPRTEKIVVDFDQQ